MRYLLILILALIPFSSFAGTGGGGVGPRPSMTMVINPKVDWVRTVDVDNEEITFLYKPFEDKTPTVKTIRVHDLNETYRKALSDSASGYQWIPVQIQQQN